MKNEAGSMKNNGTPYRFVWKHADTERPFSMPDS